MSDPRLLIGTAGWSYPDWGDVVYPRREKDKLAFVARYFNCVEINSSFYRPFTASAATKWLGAVAEHEQFRFAAKLWQRFTHETDEPFTAADVRKFEAGLAPLREAGRLSALLIQFPFFFRDSPESRDLLDRICDAFRDYPRVLEVRDVSWSESEALEFIRARGLNIACLDMPVYTRAFTPEALVTGPIGYLRLHGRNSESWFTKDAGRDAKYHYLYSDAEIEGVVERLRKIKQQAETAICIWNNHPSGQAAVNALQTAHKMLDKRLKVPPALRHKYPQLDEIAEKSGGGLFDDL